MSRHPTLKWAQRSDKIYLTVELPDAKDVKLKLEPEGKFIFSATKDGVPYEVDIELFDKIDTEESKVSIGVRHIVYVIKKTEKKWWGRLLKQEGKPPVFLKVDWDKWVDEEDENEKAGMDFDDMDFSKGKKEQKRRRSRRKENPLRRLLMRLRPDCICKR
ncbi:co-chaperone protein p23-1-like isoform X2 [Magnolia sinica]|uniref:co-chaperone protein p23-1-like isoform X2 n=1 Tax=Magnolia sinica TaxID=86752 RepID=UPI00265B7270|nr:co-chaperone protein p23-1-like isoform X2 [Magnolia sinica]